MRGCGQTCLDGRLICGYITGQTERVVHKTLLSSSHHLLTSPSAATMAPSEVSFTRHPAPRRRRACPQTHDGELYPVPNVSPSPLDTDVDFRLSTPSTRTETTSPPSASSALDSTRRSRSRHFVHCICARIMSSSAAPLLRTMLTQRTTRMTTIQSPSSTPTSHPYHTLRFPDFLPSSSSLSRSASAFLSPAALDLSDHIL